MEVTTTTARSILTRTSGYLASVTSHSLQPYRGCSFGNSLCGAYCYVQHNTWVTRGRPWGSFVEAKINAADLYRQHRERERDWARRGPSGRFSIFLSSSTDPFLPHEARFGLTRELLDAMLEAPPDALIVQTHSPRVAGEAERLSALARRCDLRVHLTIESDRDALPGLPPPAAPVDARCDAAAALRGAGVRTVITVSPLLPIAEPDAFFARLAACADAVVLDHFIGGDGTADGRRTRRTPLPDAMRAVSADSTELAYRDRMAAVARRHLPPGRVGIGADGFAGRYG